MSITFSYSFKKCNARDATSDFLLIYFRKSLKRRKWMLPIWGQMQFSELTSIRMTYFDSPLCYLSFLGVFRVVSGRFQRLLVLQEPITLRRGISRPPVPSVLALKGRPLTEPGAENCARLDFINHCIVVVWHLILGPKEELFFCLNRLLSFFHQSYDSIVTFLKSSERGRMLKQVLEKLYPFPNVYKQLVS